MITFAMTFHGPFHVATGSGEDGMDRLVNHENPLPASSLKGVMRAAATEELGIAPEIVNEVYGLKNASPWWWSPARFVGRPVIGTATRIRIDEATGTTKRGFIMFGEQVWADRAVFTVTAREIISGDQALHELVLRASARAVTSVGGQRRRGEGWVTVTDDQAWSADDTARLLRHAEGEA